MRVSSHSCISLPTRAVHNQTQSSPATVASMRCNTSRIHYQTEDSSQYAMFLWFVVGSGHYSPLRYKAKEGKQATR
jgi:hypothetical protein